MKKKIKTSEIKDHAEFSASGSDRWLNCPASISLSKGIPRFESEAATEGTNAHACFETIIKMNLKNNKFVDATVKADVDLLSKNYPRDMIYKCFEASEMILKIANKDFEVYVEKKVDASKFTKPDQFGTLDIIVTNYKNRTLHIIDFKYGWYSVPAENNSQLIYYALAAMLELGHQNFDHIHLHIIQPNANGETYKTWETDKATLISWGKKFKKAVKLADSKEPPLQEGSWCHFCPAKIACPKFTKAEIEELKLDFEKPLQIKSVPELPVIKNLGHVLSACEKVEMFIKEVRKIAYGQAMLGEKIEGYKLVDKRATRKWKNSQLVESTLIKKGFKDKIYSTPSLLSPAQIEKLFAKNKDMKSWLEKNVVKESSGLSLVRDGDNREGYDHAIEADFQAVE